jgi:hypothetical protein
LRWDHLGAHFFLHLWQAVLLALQQLLEGFPQVFEQVKLVGHLLGLGCPGACGGSVLAAAIPTDPLDVGVGTEPGFGGGRGAIGEQVERTVPLQIH